MEAACIIMCTGKYRYEAEYNNLNEIIPFCCKNTFFLILKQIQADFYLW